MTRLVLVLATVLALAPTPASAAPQDVANEVAGEIMSPYCPGVTLHDCPSEPALRMRQRIVSWAEDGWSKERIMQHLEEQWGDVIRSTPPTDGAGLVAWALPGIALLSGLLLAFLAIRSMTARRAPPAPPVSPSDRTRLEQELARMRTES